MKVEAKLAGIRDELARVAIDAQSLAHRLHHHSGRGSEHAKAVKDAAHTLADTCRALNGGATTHELAIFFPQRGQHIDDEGEGGELD